MDLAVAETGDSAGPLLQHANSTRSAAVAPSAPVPVVAVELRTLPPPPSAASDPGGDRGSFNPITILGFAAAPIAAAAAAVAVTAPLTLLKGTALNVPVGTASRESTPFETALVGAADKSNDDAAAVLLEGTGCFAVKIAKRPPRPKELSSSSSTA